MKLLLTDNSVSILQFNINSLLVTSSVMLVDLCDFHSYIAVLNELLLSLFCNIVMLWSYEMYNSFLHWFAVLHVTSIIITCITY